MIDPFRGEMTAKYVSQENLDWARRERLLRATRPAAERKGLHLPSLDGFLGSLLHGHRKAPAPPRIRLAH